MRGGKIEAVAITLSKWEMLGSLILREFFDG